MKKIVILIFLLLTSTYSFAQSAKTKSLLKEIQGQWQLDNNGNVTYTRIIQVPKLSKEEIYSRALNYFVYNYGSGKSVIQTQDKDLGRIVAKGLYKDVHVGVSIIATYISCWHVVRVDVKKGKARIIVTLTDYDIKIVGGNTPNSYSTVRVNQEYPINPKGFSKTVMGKAFYQANMEAIATIDAIEKSIKEGNASLKNKKDDW
jgi:hypothetical protein